MALAATDVRDPMFDSFTPHRISRDGVAVSAWSAGSGPAIVLLHGYPQTSHMWREIAPQLAATHQVVLMDLRGYGGSDAPKPDQDDHVYSKREMAADVASVLDSLHIDTAHIVGHDRGGRVAHRFCLDFPDRVASAAVLDIIPTLHMFDHVDRAMADAYFHWFFLTRPVAPTLLQADPAAWIRSRLAGRHGPSYEFSEDAVATYTAAFRPENIEASCADYRAAAGVDLTHDRADRDTGRRIEAPLLVAWGEHSYVGNSFDVPGVWRSYARHITPAAIEADHYIAEENPRATMDALRTFWEAV